MLSNRNIAILGFIIILLWFTQFLFSPSTDSPYVKYVDDLKGDEKGEGSRKEPFRNLQYAIDECDDGDTLVIKKGKYTAVPDTFIEELCGNCEKHNTPVIAIRGFILEGKRLTIKGSGADKTILQTNAGYGFLFLNSRGTQISGVTITGGRRDPDGNATDAGIVVKYSSVTIRDCRISDNTDFIDSVIVGIGGIIGREGSELFIFNNEILNNSWDGIALYRGSIAYIADNIIEKGRGAGIGITWDANAIILRNRITYYWKGIGSFGDSRALVKNNIVQDCLEWGIVAAGSSYMDACNNVVYHNGNCGMAAWSEDASGRFSNNIIVKNGWKEQWVAPGVGLQNYGGIENFIISHNNIWGNEAGNYGDMKDLTGVNGNISQDPSFVNTFSGDYHLKENSPCIDSGNPLITDSDGTVSDMGVYSGPGVVK
ncbi:right-handed parallel beta-helix repeat-containing protein [bacterium]|nr:right-handed parallel beta-helix repeat-containing protein [FCB group bacterium]MBL7191957.1 right-handed parallel beta-helix repeat-containing protein [bacterium]